MNVPLPFLCEGAILNKTVVGILFERGLPYLEVPEPTGCKDYAKPDSPLDAKTPLTLIFSPKVLIVPELVEPPGLGYQGYYIILTNSFTIHFLK